MEFIGKLLAVFILASSFAVGTVYVLEKGIISSQENEDVTVSTPISDVLIKRYREKLRDEYYNLKKDEKNTAQAPKTENQPMWKFEYEKK